MSKEKDVTEFLPLSPASLHILISLAGQDRHGYGIMQEVSAQSDGQYTLGPGTLYDNLQKLLDARLVEEAPAPRGETDSRRRYYRLTAFGKRVLNAEILRLETAIRAAKGRLRAPKAGRA
jgi:DNA-binding PadR family transcriptional regulator